MADTIGDVAVKVTGDFTKFLADSRKAGQQAGDEIGKAMSSSLGQKALFGGLSLAAGALTVGLGQLSNSMAKYRAETGATAAEEASAQEKLLDAYKHHKQGIDELAQGMAALRTEQGMSQEQANASIDTYATFAEVTGQQVPDAVKSMDDVLDAFNLTAEDNVKVMDAVVVAHQHGAGSMTEIQGTLARMAPALQAANMNWKDGIALLSLFGDAGIDAAKAPQALTIALSKVKSPDELKSMIKDIQTTEDSFTRGQKAADLFGAKAGQQLGQALAPGQKSLDDYKQTIDENQGALQKYADNLHDNIVYKIQQGFKELTGSLIELTSGAGPIVTAVASIITALATIDSNLTKAALAAGAKWAVILGPVAIPAAVGVGIGMGLDEADKAMGGPEHRQQQQAKELDHAFKDFDGTLGITTENMNEWIAAVNAGTASAAELYKHTLLNTDGFDGTAKAAAALTGGLTSTYSAYTDLGVVTDLVTTKTIDAGSAYTDMGIDITNTVTKTVSDVGKKVAVLPPMFKKIGYETLQGMADGITASRNEPLDAFSKLIEMMKKPLSETKETARLMGELTGKELAKGLLSADPAIRAQARATRQSILDRLEEITPAVGTMSKEAMAALAAGLKSKDPEIRKAAQNISMIIQSELALKDAKLWAQHAANAYAEGFASRKDYLAEKTRIFLGGASHQLIAASPPKEGPLKDIEKWAKATGLAWVDAFVEALGTADSKVKLTLAKVQKAFTDFISGYKGVGGLLGGATPQEDTKALQGYIANLEKQLATTTDPAARLEIYRQIAEYQSRIAELAGDTATEHQKDISALNGYIANLDKALLTETDPKKRQAMIDEISLYLQRIGIIEKQISDEADAREKKAKDDKDAKEIADAAAADAVRNGLLLKENLIDQQILKAEIAGQDTTALKAQRDAIANQITMNDLLVEQKRLQGQIALGSGAAGATDPNYKPGPWVGPGHYENPSAGVWIWVPDDAPPPQAKTPPGMTPDVGWGPGRDASGNSTAPGAANPNNPALLNNGDPNPNYNRDVAPGGWNGGPPKTVDEINQSASTGTNITVNVHNPAPEPASTSTSRELRLLAATGLTG